MKKISTLLLLSVTILSFTLCKKESPRQNPPQQSRNQSPIADAGADLTINFPDSVELSGSASDSDVQIVSYRWTKLTGPPYAHIVHPDAATTKVTNLASGIYEFELEVRDNGGLSAKDRIQVTVNINRFAIPLQLIPVGMLSQSRSGLAVVAAGNQLLFAGGFVGTTALTTVDIYNTQTQTWSTASLSEARVGMTVASAGNKIYFSGGAKEYNVWAGDDPFFNWYLPSSRMDIYDASSNSWSVAELPIPRAYLVSAVVGNKLFLAGGYWPDADEDLVNIYDLTSSTWSNAKLSERRTQVAAAAAGDIIFFAGGSQYGLPSNRLDMYHTTTNTWSLGSLSSASYKTLAVTLGSKAFFANQGTVYSLASVDIYDLVTQTWSIGFLSGNYLTGAATLGNKVFFFETSHDKTRMDVYDVRFNTWATAELNVLLLNMFAAGDKLYATNGSQVWQVQL